MGKRFKEEDEIDRLQRQIRELKATNKTLMRKIKSLNKGYYKFLLEEDHQEEEKAKEQAKEIAKKICYMCHIGEMVRYELGNRYYRKCSNNECQNRTKSKPIKD